jgi:hypothetical protein
MNQYRKKPVVIEALRVPVEATDDHERFMAGHGFIAGWFIRHDFRDYNVADDMGYDIHTLEGVMHASPGDFIIRGVQGEFYPCKPDIFEATYEPITGEPQ